MYTWTMGMARILSRGGGTLFQNFEKNFEKNSKNVRKFVKVFLRKLLKMHYFSIFSQNLTNHALLFRAFGRKNKLLGNFENF